MGQDIRTIDFMDPPSESQIQHAIDTLKHLGALDQQVMADNT